MRSLRTMMMFWVRSSAPCLELFSAAPVGKKIKPSIDQAFINLNTNQTSRLLVIKLQVIPDNNRKLHGGDTFLWFQDLLKHISI